VDNQSSRSDLSPRRYAFDVREATIRDFDDGNKAQLETTLAELGKILMIKIIAVAKGCDLATGARFDAFALSKSALDVLVSALQMARQRAAVETFSLLRVALESGSTALHISRNVHAYEQYTMGKYKSTDAISFAKSAVPILGEIWGALSNSAVHITQLGYGPRLNRDEHGNLTPTVSIECNIRSHQPFQDQLLLSFVSLVATIVLKITELTLFQQSHSREAWLKLPGTQMEYFHNTDALISKYYADVTSISETKAIGEE
jgi:hypothetical protein